MRLLCPLVPIPLESLESFVERLAKANYYQEKRWLLSLLPNFKNQRIDLLRSAAQYRALADLTGLNIYELAEMTLHRFVSHFYSPRKVSCLPVEDGDLDIPMWDWSGVEVFLYGQSNCRICPLCWKEQNAILLPWHLRHVTTCPIHLVLLVDYCSKCGKKLRFDFTSGNCFFCEKNVTTLPLISIRNHLESMVLTSLIWHRIFYEPNQFVVIFPFLKLTHPLRQMDPSQLFEFLLRFPHLLSKRDPQNPIFNFEPLSLDATRIILPVKPNSANIMTTHVMQIAVIKLFIHWPDIWYTALERLAEIDLRGEFDSVYFPKILANYFEGERWQWLHLSWLNFMWGSAERIDTVICWIHYFLHFKKYFKWDLGELDPGLSYKNYIRDKYLSEPHLLVDCTHIDTQ